MTPQECADALKSLDIEVGNTIVNGIRRAQGYWRKRTLLGVTTRGIGRAIWGEKKLTTLRAIIKRTRVTKEGDGYTGGLEIRGLAALMETGGRILPHLIPNAFGKVTAHHPGAPVPATPSAAPAVPEVEAFMAIDMERGLQKAIAKARLNG